MRLLEIPIKEIFEIKKFGNILFLIGIFLLPSAIIISVFFLLSSAIIGSFKNKRHYFSDKWNYPFFVSGIIILINAILQNHFLINNFEEIWDPKLSFIGIFNWLPFFWIFWAFQAYLDSGSKRKLFAISLISGTFPVLLSGFSQYFFNFSGPFQLFDGLIIWFQRPIKSNEGLTALFSNQNYAGSWFNFCWPFSIAFLLDKSQNVIKRTFSLGFLISIGFSIFLTSSRNAWLGLLISMPLVIGQQSLIWLSIIFFIFFVFLIFSLNSFFSGELGEFFDKNYFIFLENFQFDVKEIIESKRIGIYLNALNILKLSPLIGIGAASFGIINESKTGIIYGHSHNLLLELAISYGLPATIIILITVNMLLISSAKKIFFNVNGLTKTNFYDRAIWSGIFCFLISQLFDIQYFDGKISIIAWVLLASLRNIIDD